MIRSAVVTAAVLAIQGCTPRPPVTPFALETLTYEGTESSVYTLERLRASVRTQTDEQGRETYSLGMSGIARDVEPKGTPRRVKNLLRIESIHYSGSAVPLRLPKDQIGSQRIDPIIQYDTYTRDERVLAMDGFLAGVDPSLGEIMGVAGTAIVYEADEICYRRLNINQTIIDHALLRIAPGVYVGVVSSSQDEQTFRAMLRYWVARTLEARSGKRLVMDPPVPLSFSVSTSGDPGEAIGSMPIGLRHADSAAPDLLELAFLDQDGSVIYTTAEAGLLLEFETGYAGEMEIAFEKSPGTVVTELLTTVVTKDRPVEIPFTAPIHELPANRQGDPTRKTDH